MAKAYRSSGGSGSASGGARPSSGSRSTGSSNTRMWSQSATPKQIAALKAHGNFDGKYYSKGRAGQTIGQSVRNAGNGSGSPSSPGPEQLHPLNGVVIEHMVGAQVSSPAPTASTHEVTRYVAPASAQHSNVLEEGTPMSQLVPVQSYVPDRGVAAVVNRAPSAQSDVAPFAYVPDLVSTLLAPLAATTDPSQVRALEKSLTIAKGTLAKELTRVRNTLVGILREAPTGTFASPEASAEEILWNACSADLEQRLMQVTHVSKGRSEPSKVIDELLAQVRHRVELAIIQANDLVEVAKIQAALPPAPTRGYGPCWGEVTGVKNFGAFVRLPSGESGLLHRSELNPSRDGTLVQDATSVVNVGQMLFVRVTGKNDKGLSLALEGEL